MDYEMYVTGAFALVAEIRLMNKAYFKDSQHYMFGHQRGDEQFIVTNVNFKDIKLPYGWYFTEYGTLTNKHKNPKYYVYKVCTLREFVLMPY